MYICGLSVSKGDLYVMAKETYYVRKRDLQTLVIICNIYTIFNISHTHDICNIYTIFDIFDIYIYDIYIYNI